MSVHISEIGEVDDSTDLWSLFQSDAHGKTGLFAGQLMRELSERAPQWGPRLDEIIRRGLVSDDPAERAAALHGALQMPSAELGSELEQLSLRHADWLAKGISAAGRPVISMFLEALEREPQGSEAAVRALAAVRAMVPRSEPTLARALVRLEPEQAAAEVLSSLAGAPDELASALLKQLSFSSRFADLTQQVAGRSAEEKRRFVDLAFAALGADQFAAAYDRWKELAQSLSSVPENPPPPPVQSEASQKFAEMLKSMAAAEAAAAEAPSGPFVLSAEVWADGLRMPEGPPAELFALLAQKRDQVLMSEPLLADIKSRLTQLGWPDPLVQEAEARVRQNSTLQPVAGAGAADVALAQAAHVDTVYTVGPRSGSVDGGVALHPVHELLAKLKA
jgi:hypothetical protein